MLTRTSVEVLLLWAVGVACASTLVSASPNVTSGPDTVTSSNRNATTPNNDFQETCHAPNLQDASRTISAAVDTLAVELSCKRGRNASLPEDKSRELEENLRQIMKSTLKVFFDLGSNQSGFSVLDVLGVLDSLSLRNHSDSRFIRLWFSLKMAPLLPHVDENFLIQLSSQNFSCNSFQELIEALSDELETSKRTEKKLIYTHFIQVYLSRKNLPEPGCKQNVNGSAEWLKRNLGNFSIFASLQDLKTMNNNFSAEETLEKLSPSQKAELLLDPDSRASEDEAFVKVVFSSLRESRDEDQLNQFFQAFASITQQRNITIITNPGVRHTILNLTLAALAPQFEDFEPKDFELWFQDYLAPVMSSLRPDSLVVIPRNISCASYAQILTGLRQSLRSLPLPLSHGVRASIDSLEDTFTRCSLPASFMCKRTPVNEDLICDTVNKLALQQMLSSPNSSAALCNFTITEHACSMAPQFTPTNLATLLKCSLESQRVYPVEVWKLFIQKASPALDQALQTFATMAPNNTSPSLSGALDALGEVRIANFSQAQLQSDDFVSEWFQTTIHPFLASASPNFLFCLSTKNFSCHTYPTVIQAFGSQRPSMERETQKAVFTHFIKPFLSRNHSSDPGCVSVGRDSAEWIQANFGNFSGFASLQDLQALNPNLSIAQSLSALTPTQMAQLALSSGVSNDTQLIDRVFERLEEGNSLESVDQFLTELTANGRDPDFQPVVRDRVMNRTFRIISPHFPNFTDDDWSVWFQFRLVPLLPSFSATMLSNATSNITCTNYHVVLSGLARAFPAMTLRRRQRITDVLLDHLRNSASVNSEPVCRQRNQSDAQWLEANFGPFSQYATYSELRAFNISGVTILDSLSPSQKAELLLEPNNLTNETLVRLVFTELTETSHVDDLGSFFDKFVRGAAHQNLTTIDPRVRDAILNLTLMALGPKLSMLDVEGFKLWFQVYLPLFLPSIQSSTFEIIPRNISCDSYQEIIKGCNSVFTLLTVRQTQQVFTFIKDYLKRRSSSGLSCVESVSDDRHWLEDNFGQFRERASYTDFEALKSNFSGVEVADLLTLNQLAELTATPSQLKGRQDVTKIMTAINPVDFGAFFDMVSPAIKMHPDNYTEEVKSALLQATFDRGNLSSRAINDTEFLLWLRVRLSPLLVNLSPNLVTPLFDIGKNRSCNSSQEMIQLLDSLKLTLSNNTQREIYQNIFLLLQGPVPVKCYGGGSFYSYLRNTFLRFGFPNVPMLTSLLPQARKSELLNTISTSELHQFLSQPNVVGNDSDTCVIFNNYNNTPVFLETEDVPDDVKMVILPCVWPLALRSNNRSEVDSWFNLRLRNYLRFLSKSLISPNEVQNASCLAFQKLVSVMGNNFTYKSSEFGQGDVYTTIRAYLRTGSGARCYHASDPELNSTAWFVNNIGSFVTFITLDDLTSFLSTNQTGAFFADQANLELFNNTAIPENVTNYYISQLYEFNPTFSPVKLPGLFLCSSEVPSSAYSSLGESDTIQILNKLKEFCNGTENTEVSAALASNLQTITADTLESLGSASAGLTSSQITSVPPSVLISSMPTLGSVSTWNQEQAMTIVQTITDSGFQINRGSSLESLGTLVAGVPSATIQNIPASELLNISRSSTFVSNMLTAPTAVQQTFVNKIISVDSSPAQVVANVPDAMATEIPPSLLDFSGANADISVINKKTWTSTQASMFFGTLGETNFDIEQLSPSVLQGFTCSSVQGMKKARIRKLIRACRPRRRRARCQLRESQLTCMYNLLSGDMSQNFTDYPSDMLLFFNNKDVNRTNCRSYFSALGAADFSVTSKVLNKDSQLLGEARSCLGINSVNLSRDDVEVLGNMVCTLDNSSIENADPLILEKLKACKDFSDSQVAAIETLLLSGKTQYGNLNTWKKQTLENLGLLPLYFTRNIWDRLKTKTKRRFLRSFMPELRKRKTERKKLKALSKQLRAVRTKRGAGCTVGNITQVTVNDPSFPFGYDNTQFDLCLDVPVLKDNLYSICEKVNDDNLQEIILKKLNQALPSGLSDETVQMLDAVSRVATLDDISKWNITTPDTLAALMNADDGSWEAAKSKEIINKYLNTSGNSLGSTELNAIDSNLCSLDTSTLRTITSDSIKNAKPLNVESCSSEQKRVLYEISKTSFSSQSSNANIYYNLIKTYLGGANLSDVVELSTKNISMDISTFRSLDPNVIANLTVTDIKGLLGSMLPNLKLFENDTVINGWINRQSQSDLDILGLGLTTTSGSSQSNSSTTATTSTVAPTQENKTNSTATLTIVATTQANATSGGAELVKYPTSIFLAVLLPALLQVLQQPA